MNYLKTKKIIILVFSANDEPANDENDAETQDQQNGKREI